ncbi:MAG TPA: YraN family protein [Chitinophagaceae bacterium]|nr:YraN family protein [Chitinophagaceae bacterium]
MAKHQLLGKQGELLAAAWLQAKGFTILEVNWRHSYYEIDIVATINQVLHFIEVKTRVNKKFGEPEESVGKKKIARMLTAGAAYHAANPQWTRVQYDVLSISLLPGETIDYFFIEDVYL